jgi:hypothetical protein
MDTPMLARSSPCPAGDKRNCRRRRDRNADSKRWRKRSFSDASVNDHTAKYRQREMTPGRQDVRMKERL